MIDVTNSSDQEIEVAINQWGDDGETGFFDISPGEKEEWQRYDEKGFLMIVKKGGAQRPYYVLHNSSIIVSNDKVTDSGSTIDPLS